MKAQAKPVDAGPFWAEYKPGADAPWNRRRVVHLHRRAGFAATWAEAERDLRDGPKASVDRLLKSNARAASQPDEFRQTADQLADAAVASGDAGRLKAWWVYRMLFGADVLAERLALLWHDHFATSNLKVADLAAMRQQNELFRRHARGPFGELLRAAAHDAALLRWLDADTNRKGRPNENLARELMELFTLGIGHYTETDVKEAARALTGWTLVDGGFRHDPARHDEGEKTILGRKGHWRGDDLVRMLLEHPATAHRLAWRICDLLMGEGIVTEAGLDALAEGLRRHDLDIGWAVETVLRSGAFFAPANLGARVLGPVEYVVGAPRALELSDPPPSSLVLADWMARLGQDLLYPPNVGGWPGGRGWISPHTLIGRANFAAALVDGGLGGSPRPFDALALPRRHGRNEDLDSVLAFYAELLLGDVPGPAWCDHLRTSLGSDAKSTPQTLRRLVALVLAWPAAVLA
jgi:uncharacterized protein (DUF1800 family)